MKSLLLLVLLTSTLISNAQIKTLNSAKGKIVKTPYDSLTNFVGKHAYQLLGQELYVLETKNKFDFIGFKIKHIKRDCKEGGDAYKQELMQLIRQGASSKERMDFYNNYKSRNVYKPNKKTSRTDYDSVAGKYYFVDSVLPSLEVNENIYPLRIIAKDSGDTLYYKYRSESVSYFPFLIVGYYEKTLQLFENQRYILRDLKWKYDGANDLYTGESIRKTKGEVWRCTDIIVNDQSYLLHEPEIVLTNSDGQSISTSMKWIRDEKLIRSWGFFTVDDKSKIYKTYGRDVWLNVLAGILTEGYTEELVIYTRGYPEEINKSNPGSDQWVYENQYLYIKEGKLEGWN